MLLAAPDTIVGQQAVRAPADTAVVCSAALVDTMGLHTGRSAVAADSIAAGNRKLASVAVASVHN